MKTIFLLVLVFTFLYLFKWKLQGKSKLITEKNTTPIIQSTKNEKITILNYYLYILMPLFVITIPLMVVPLFISYFQKSKVKSTYLESHYIWQLRTFWFSLVWAVVGFYTMYFLIGVLVLGLDFLWFVYRNFQGLNKLSSRKEIYNVSTKLLFKNIFILVLWFAMVFFGGYYIYSVTT